MEPLVELKEAVIAQDKRPVLQEVDLRIMPGEFTYLIGKTGTGKSTLLKTLYAALPLEHGSGRVAGYDLKKLTRKTIPHLRRELGIVFQDFNLLEDRSVEDNLRFVLQATGWKKADLMTNRVVDALESVGLKEKQASMPYQLSGGEQQRVAIARALLNTPKLIIADEPTGNLDPETSDEIVLLLLRLNREKKVAVLFATHDYRILESYPARIIRCKNGRLIEEKEISL